MYDILTKFISKLFSALPSYSLWCVFQTLKFLPVSHVRCCHRSHTSHMIASWRGLTSKEHFTQLNDSIDTMKVNSPEMCTCLYNISNDLMQLSSHLTSKVILLLKHFNNSFIFKYQSICDNVIIYLN